MTDLAGLAGLPRLGAGLAYSSRIPGDIFASDCRIDFVEIIVEHYLDAHPARLAQLRQLAERYPVVCHGVDMSVGTAEPLDESSLAVRLRSSPSRGRPGSVTIFVSPRLTASTLDN